MYIAGSFIDRLLDNLIDQKDNRCIIYLFVTLLLLLSGALLLTSFFGIRLCHSRNLFIPIIPFNSKANIRRCCHHGFNLHIRHDRKIINGDNIHGIRHCHPENVRIIRIQFKGNYIVFSHNCLRQKSNYFRCQFCLSDFCNRKSHLLMKCFRNLVLVCKVQFNQRLTKPETQFSLFFQSLLQLFIGDYTGIHQQVTQTLSFSTNHMTSPLVFCLFNSFFFGIFCLA